MRSSTPSNPAGRTGAAPVLGIDLGTSGVKALLLDGERVLGTAHAPLSVSRPHPGWSEQEPEDWWAATCACLDALVAEHPTALRAVRAIGLAGHMHGATLVDADGEVLRPCILWDDGRSAPQCALLEAAVPALRAITGNAAMPGFTAPKLLWIRQHEPDLFARMHRVLLPKAWLRWRLCGEAIEDMSDASGTLWLDVARRRWSGELLAACGLDESRMPRLVEGTMPAGELRAPWVKRWGFERTPIVAGGAGDNAAGAVALGAVNPGDAFLSLGTSGVLWATTAHHAPAPERGVHAFCHAVPQTWHQMGVLLSAAASLSWWAACTGRDEQSLLAELPAQADGPAPCWFLPYLSGERTPHNDASVRGAFLHLSAGTTRPQMTQAVLEGVAHAFRDARDALAGAGTHIAIADLIGGGARSSLWCDLLASMLDISLRRIDDASHGPALGAARLAQVALTGRSDFPRPHATRVFEPRPALVRRYDEAHAGWSQLYSLVRRAPGPLPVFNASDSVP
ncbi:xylulokinase [Piscinibacter sp.]|uniref:xylulokinase n=1 Tax=Piscinibacter sp. TaxID=1903157 RepID=UPI002B9899EA|nr:xylulokinase [Albitalea sp.]HUG25577.1 xylulokinase [Albitalea sp.]